MSHRWLRLVAGLSLAAFLFASLPITVRRASGAFPTCPGCTCGCLGEASACCWQTGGKKAPCTAKAQGPGDRTDPVPQLQAATQQPNPVLPCPFCPRCPSGCPGCRGST